MKKMYQKPLMNIFELDKEAILTASAITNTTNALKSGTLYVNGMPLSSVSNLISVDF